jgi:glycosyltransferase involved in cell wall biosynthesis
MKIAVDLTQIPINKTGIGIYAVNLVREMIRLNRDNSTSTLYFFAQDDDPQWNQLLEGAEGCRLVTVNSRFYRKLILRFFFEQILFPRQCKKLGIDLIYSFHYTMPYLTSIKRVVTIPDMTFYLFPQMHQLVKRIYFKSLIPLSLKKSDAIVTISTSTKTDLVKRFPHINPGKIHVIHLGVNTTPPPADSQTHLANFGLCPNKYLLYVGTLEPRKNISAIIVALHHLSRTTSRTTPQSPIEDFKLVLVGKKGWFYESIFETAAQYGMEKNILFTGYVNEEVKHSLLANAFLFVYPSFYEGFGLPILEAMAHGIPVITGNISSLPEVAGNAALLVDPHKPVEIADAMNRLLTDHHLHQALSTKSLAQARRFSWHSTAQKTLELFNAL